MDFLATVELALESGGRTGSHPICSLNVMCNAPQHPHLRSPPANISYARPPSLDGLTRMTTSVPDNAKVLAAIRPSKQVSPNASQIQQPTSVLTGCFSPDEPLVSAPAERYSQERGHYVVSIILLRT